MSDPINKPLAIITRTVVGLMVLGFSLGIAFYLKETRPQIKQTPLDQSLPQVQVLNVTLLPVNLQWSGYGSITAMDRSDIPSRVNSIIDNIPGNLQPGVHVKAGQVIATLDAADFVQQQQIAQQNINQINANLRKLNTEEAFLNEQMKLNEADVQLAQSEWDRAKDLYARKAGTQQDIDRAHQVYLVRQRTLLSGNMQRDQVSDRRMELNAQLKAQQETLTRAELDVKRCGITSPMDGILQTLDVDLGEIVTAGKRIAQVVSLKRMEVALQLPASSRDAVGIGDRVILSPVGSRRVQWENKIARIAPQDDPTTRTFSIYIQFDQTSPQTSELAPGRYVQGTVYSHVTQKQWLVPVRSIQADQIMIVRDGRVKTLPAQITHLIRKQFQNLNLEDQSWAILGTNLKSGDSIILTPSRLVSDGKQVQPVVVADQVSVASGEEQ